VIVVNIKLYSLGSMIVLTDGIQNDYEDHVYREHEALRHMKLFQKRDSPNIEFDIPVSGFFIAKDGLVDPEYGILPDIPTSYESPIPTSNTPLNSPIDKTGIYEADWSPL